MVYSHRGGHGILVYYPAQVLDQDDEEVPDDDEGVERGYRRFIGGETQVAVSALHCDLTKAVGQEHNREGKKLKKENCPKGLFTEIALGTPSGETGRISVLLAVPCRRLIDVNVLCLDLISFDVTLESYDNKAKI